MQVVLIDQARLVMLIGLCGLLWLLESIIPLYRFRNSRLRHALPNVALTLMLVFTNRITLASKEKRIQTIPTSFLSGIDSSAPTPAQQIFANSVMVLMDSMSTKGRR
ncbi:MAG TPA: hypothetical protein VLA93_14920 [Pyrinomonadaceae bacterium]|nr:hypothetical protein [Pyrinomonadaceae bacterium]